MAADLEANVRRTSRHGHRPTTAAASTGATVTVSLATRRLFDALNDANNWPGAVVAALEHLELEPLASAGYFPGDVVRRLMQLPPGFWRREPALDARYRSVVRAAALARRGLPTEVRQAFWRDLPALSIPFSEGGPMPGDAS
jgi:hypothetical protein